MKEDVLLSALIIAVSSVSFFLGRVSVEHQIPPVFVSDTPQEAQLVSIELNNEKQSTSTPLPEPASYVASKSGTKYHLPWCPGAKQIKNSNKIYFKTKEEAEKAGYGPASNCKGI